MVPKRVMGIERFVFCGTEGGGGVKRGEGRDWKGGGGLLSGGRGGWICRVGQRDKSKVSEITQRR